MIIIYKLLSIISELNYTVTTSNTIYDEMLRNISILAKAFMESLQW